MHMLCGMWGNNGREGEKQGILIEIGATSKKDKKLNTTDDGLFMCNVDV